MEKIGFKRGVASPCVFYMRDRNLRVVVHGDDFTVLGYVEDLDWFRRMISEEYEVKFRGRIGPGEDDDKSIRILNRVVEWSPEGIWYEADQRHAEIIVDRMGLSGSGKGVVTPGMRKEEEPGDDEELNRTDSTAYRGLVARGNYLTQDRSDIQYAVKELSRAMASPTVGDWKSLKRLARYLVDRTRVKVKFEYQEWKRKIGVYVDTDYAGCRKTRKSTSGGVALIGNHMIKSWSTTQAVIALSSGEAEFYGIVKGSSIGIGIRSVLADLGVDCRIGVHTDASAAKAIASRKGLGKVRHIEVNQLWIQDRVGSGDVELYKIPGTINPADALTKYVESEILIRHLNMTSQFVCQGRHVIMPQVS